LTAPSGTNVQSFMQVEGIADFDTLLARSIAEPEWFWDAVVRFLGIRFQTPYDKVLDTTGGIPWATWFTGGTLNAADVCVDRHAEEHPDRWAVVWEGEDGEVRQWTYGELRRQADALAQLLSDAGVGEGDAVGVFLPMVPETVATLFGIAKLGAVFLPLFSGFAAAAVSSRLDDAGAVALVTADGFSRRGALVPMLETARAAVDASTSVRSVVVVPRTGRPMVLSDGETEWPDAATVPFATRAVESEHPLFIAYTSGTTGRPKGSVHVHAGLIVKIAEEAAFQFDVRPPDHATGGAGVSCEALARVASQGRRRAWRPEGGSLWISVSTSPSTTASPCSRYVARSTCTPPHGSGRSWWSS